MCRGRGFGASRRASRIASRVAASQLSQSVALRAAGVVPCAGAILLAHEVTGPPQASLDLMNISVERNAYGRQIDSRIAKLPVKEGGEMEAVFIRAPIIRKAGEGVRVLAEYQGDPVWVEQGRHMVTTFHPELTEDSTVHRRFLEKL